MKQNHEGRESGRYLGLHVHLGKFGLGNQKLLAMCIFLWEIRLLLLLYYSKCDLKIQSWIVVVWLWHKSQKVHMVRLNCPEIRAFSWDDLQMRPRCVTTYLQTSNALIDMTVPRRSFCIWTMPLDFGEWMYSLMKLKCCRGFRDYKRWQIAWFFSLCCFIEGCVNWRFSKSRATVSFRARMCA